MPYEYSPESLILAEVEEEEEALVKLLEPNLDEEFRFGTKGKDLKAMAMEEEEKEDEEFEVRAFRIAASMTSKKAPEVSRVAKEMGMRLESEGYCINRVHTDMRFIQKKPRGRLRNNSRRLTTVKRKGRSGSTTRQKHGEEGPTPFQGRFNHLALGVETCG